LNALNIIYSFILVSMFNVSRQSPLFWFLTDKYLFWVSGGSSPVEVRESWCPLSILTIQRLVVLPCNLDGIREPLSTLSVFPFTLHLCALFGVILDANSMLKVVPPGAGVLLSGRPGHRAVSILLSLGEVTLIDMMFFGGQAALPFEGPIKETSFIHFVISCKELDSLTCEQTLL